MPNHDQLEKNLHCSKSDLLNHQGFIVNLKTLSPRKEDNSNFFSPHLLNLREERKKESRDQKPLPNNFLNLKSHLEKNFVYPETICQSQPSALTYSQTTRPFETNFSKIDQIRPKYYFGQFIRNKKGTFYFTLLCLLAPVIILGFSFYQKFFDIKDGVLSKANVAYADIQDAQDYLKNENYQKASFAFSQASNGFSASIAETKKLGFLTNEILNLIPIKNKLASGPALLKTGEYLSESGKYLTAAMIPFQNLNPIYAEGQQTSEPNQLTFTEALEKSSDNILISLNNLQKAEKEIKNIDINSFEPNLREKIALIQNNVPLARYGLEKFIEFNKNLLLILGHDKPQKYLLLFQNNSEIRATGGFIGTYGLVDLNAGQISKIEIDGIYNPDGQMLEKISPPDPLRFTNNRWFSRDANWFPDFPTSAQKVASLLEKTGKPSVDGVIALTPNVMVELLKITGPIEMPEYNTTVDADNFVIQTEREVELEYNRAENRPKQFLTDLAPIVLNKIFNTKESNWPALISALSKAFLEKHILLYSFKPELQNFIISKGWGGEIKSSPRDYLQVVNTNINGGKTDNLIQETLDLSSEITDTGEIINTLEITRHHTGNNDWPSISNIDYIRVYVPKGSTLLEATGFNKVNLPSLTYEEMQYSKDPTLEEIRKTSIQDEASNTTITQEFNKTCFGNWVSVKPQEEVKVKIKYKLPFQIKTNILNNAVNYTLLAQKQSGSFDSRLNFNLKLPENLKMAWRYPTGNGLEWATILRTDQYFGTTLEKK